MPISELPGTKNAIKDAIKRIYRNEYISYLEAGNTEMLQHSLAVNEEAYLTLAYFVAIGKEENIKKESETLLQEWYTFTEKLQARVNIKALTN